MQDIFVGRQPMLDRRQGLIGYELQIAVADANGTPAPAELIAKAFNELGLARALAGCLAFIPVDAEFLSAAQASELAADAVILQVDATVLVHEGTCEQLLSLHATGLRYCIAGLCRFDPELQPVMAQADYLKVDRAKVAADTLQALICDLHTTRKPVIITAVDDVAQFEFCTLVDADGYQGYYFAEARQIEGRTLDPGAQTLFRLIGQLNADAEIDQLEQTFRSDPLLVVHMLRLTNSAGVGARSRITSVRHAINVLGRKQLQRWLQLLLFRLGGDAEFGCNPLMQYAALRGRFMELLATRFHAGDTALRDAAFITGLVSVLPAALGLSLREILDHLPVDDAVRSALLNYDGALGRLLGVIEAYDANDVVITQTRLGAYPSATLNNLAEILGDALAWVTSLGTEAE